MKLEIKAPRPSVLPPESPKTPAPFIHRPDPKKDYFWRPLLSRMPEELEPWEIWDGENGLYTQLPKETPTTIPDPAPAKKRNCLARLRTLLGL